MRIQVLTKAVANLEDLDIDPILAKVGWAKRMTIPELAAALDAFKGPQKSKLNMMLNNIPNDPNAVDALNHLVPDLESKYHLHSFKQHGNYLGEDANSHNMARLGLYKFMLSNGMLSTINVLQADRSKGYPFLEVTECAQTALRAVLTSSPCELTGYYIR